MTNINSEDLKNKLSELRDRLSRDCDAQDWRYQGIESYSPMDNEDFYKAGFNALLPILLDACEKLNYYGNEHVLIYDEESFDDDCEQNVDKPWRYESGLKARKFLQSLDTFLKGEK